MAQNLAVAASDISPPVADGYHLLNYEYRRCGKYEYIPHYAPTTIECHKQAIGRYVYVFLDTYGNKQLALCEVEVYGERELRFHNPMMFYFWYTKNYCFFYSHVGLHNHKHVLYVINWTT